MSRFKQIKSIKDFDTDNEDECLFYITYDKDLTEIVLTLNANRPLTPVEYIESLSEFMNKISETPDDLFVEDCVDENTPLH